MAREARSQFAILGMLTLGPMSGYELKLRIAQSIGHFWQESFGQLYPALSLLEERGLVSSRQVAEGERERRVYTITKRGRAELRAWLAKPAPRHVERNELLLKLFFGSEVDVATSMGQLQRSRDDAAQRLSALREIGAVLARQLAGSPGHDYYWATLRNGELGLEAHLRWCDEVLERLGSLRASSSVRARSRKGRVSVVASKHPQRGHGDRA
jgi:PadR family transcriptional regulator AphA